MIYPACYHVHNTTQLSLDQSGLAIRLPPLRLCRFVWPEEWNSVTVFVIFFYVLDIRGAGEVIPFVIGVVILWRIMSSVL
jgi:hypothetical protein